MDFKKSEPVCGYFVTLLTSSLKTILEATHDLGNFVRAFPQKGTAVTAQADFWKLDHTQRWYCCVLNPPFTPMRLGYDFLFACMELTDTVVALMPYLTFINSEKRLTTLQRFGLVSITHLPRSAFARSRVQTCILHMSWGYCGTTSFYRFVFPSKRVS